MGLFDFLRGSKKQTASPKPEIKRRARSATATVVQKRPRQKPPKLEHAVLSEWRSELKKIQEHPLTQAKVVNEKLLAAVMELLNEINTKIDTLNERMAKIEAQKATVRERESEVKLSSGEQKVFDFVKKKKSVQAGEVAANLKISRPNAALKLSKLYSIGLLEKSQEGKDVYYKPV